MRALELPVFLTASATGYFLRVCVSARVHACVSVRRLKQGFFISEFLLFSIAVSKNENKMRLIKLLKIGKVLKSLGRSSYRAASSRLRHGLVEDLFV